MTLNNENTIIFSIARLSIRENLFKWIGPIYNRRVYLYRLKNRGDVVVNSLSDARHYKIVAGRSDAEILFLQSKNFNIDLIVNSKKQKLIMLLRGRVELAPMSDVTLNYWAKKLGQEPSNFEQAILINGLGDLAYVAASNKTPDHTVKILREALKK